MVFNTQWLNKNCKWGLACYCVSRWVCHIVLCTYVCVSLSPSLYMYKYVYIHIHTCIYPIVIYNAAKENYAPPKKR